MTRRPVPWAWIAGAVALSLAAAFAWWAADAFERVDTITIAPARGEAARDPLYAARRLVGTLGGTAVAADGFQRLPPPGAVLVLGSPHANLFPGGIEALLAWVRGGGRLVLDLNALQNAELAAALPLERAGEEDTTNHLRRLPQRMRDLLSETTRCQALEEPANVPATYGAARRTLDWCGQTVDAIETDEPLAWALAQGMALRVARIAVDAGSVTLSGLAQPFDRAAVLDKQNALAFAATLDLRPGDTVWFLGDRERATLLSLLWQHGWPAIALLGAAVACALWREGVRFGPLAAPPTRARRSVGEQVRRTAAFIAARGGGVALHAAAVRALEDRARRVVGGWRDDAPIPERAERIAAHADAEAERHARAARRTDATAVVRPATGAAGGAGSSADRGRLAGDTSLAAPALDRTRLAAALRSAAGRTDRRALADALATLEQARRALLEPRAP